MTDCHFALVILFTTTDVVQVVSDFTDMVYGLVVRSVTAVCETDLEILSVKTSCCSLVGELMPMSSDEIRVFKG